MPLRKVFWIGFILKLAAGLAIGWVYKYYYTYPADTFLYFEDASTLSRQAWENPSSYFHILFFNQFDTEALFSLDTQPRAFFMAKLISFFTLLTGGNYWLTSLYMSVLSFYGFWRLANTLVLIFPTSRIASTIAFLLFPSVVFWSSGLIKESIAMACITGSLHLLLAYHVGINATNSPRRKLWHILFILLSCYLVWKLKYYYLAVLLPVCMAYIVTTYLHKRLLASYQPGRLAAIFLLVFTCILVVATGLHPSLRTEVLLGTIIENHDVSLAASSPEDVIRFNQLQPEFASLLKNLPLAVVSGLFRPFIWEGNTLFQWFTGFENLALLLLTLIAFFQINRTILFRDTRMYLLLLSVLVYILLLSTLLALSSPNFGTLARYKAGFLPFLTYLLIWPISFRILHPYKLL